MSVPPQSAGAGPSGGMALPQERPQNHAPQVPPPQNLNQIVLEYLLKKGYTKTEATLRQESTNVDRDGRPLVVKEPEPEPVPVINYRQAFDLVSSWIETNLDIYKLELSRLLWPIFVYSYLELVSGGISTAREYFDALKHHFELVHSDELKLLSLITLTAHVTENSTSKLYRDNKYRIPLNGTAYFNLITFLEVNTKQGGAVVLRILQTHCTIVETKRGPIDQYSFEAIINATREAYTADTVAQEGIAGGFTGVSNQDMNNNSAPVKLGVQPLDPDLISDVRAALEDDDRDTTIESDQPSLVELFDAKIKREEDADAIGKHDLPYPPSKARDVHMEVQKIKEYRDRFKIEGRTGGVGPAVSVCMFTLHNTLDTVTCMEFSDDTELIAVGTEESYIRVWNRDGTPLKSVLKGPEEATPSSSRRLIGHSAPVYSISFSPSTSAPSPGSTATAPKFLLSSSSDATIRLWSLELWSCLVVYKGHHGPVWNVRWGPSGHYFASCGWDKTVRVWTQDHVSCHRILVGHDSNVNMLAYHPNGMYVFSASDTVDKTVRMWCIPTAQCVRVFTGHTEFISAMECSPDGKTLASADGSGSIILWDLEKGTQIKRMRGHGRGGIWSLSFSVESTVLTSGGADGTVRIWDVQTPADPVKNADGDIIASTGQADATRINGNAPVANVNASGSGSMTGVSKKRGKDKIITQDQISAFPTKKTPVYKVKFTRMNLVLAGGCFLP